MTGERSGSWGSQTWVDSVTALPGASTGCGVRSAGVGAAPSSAQTRNRHGCGSRDGRELVRLYQHGSRGTAAAPGGSRGGRAWMRNLRSTRTRWRRRRRASPRSRRCRPAASPEGMSPSVCGSSASTPACSAARTPTWPTPSGRRARSWRPCTRTSRPSSSRPWRTPPSWPWTQASAPPTSPSPDGATGWAWGPPSCPPPSTRVTTSSSTSTSSSPPPAPHRASGRSSPSRRPTTTAPSWSWPATTRSRSSASRRP